MNSCVNAPRNLMRSFDNCPLHDSLQLCLHTACITARTSSRNSSLNKRPMDEETPITVTRGGATENSNNADQLAGLASCSELGGTASLISFLSAERGSCGIELWRIPVLAIVATSKKVNVLDFRFCGSRFWFEYRSTKLRNYIQATFLDFIRDWTGLRLSDEKRGEETTSFPCFRDLRDQRYQALWLVLLSPRAISIVIQMRDTSTNTVANCL